MEVLFATTNPAKIKYYAEELENRGIKVHTLQEMKIQLSIEENGKNSVENARIKAKAYYEASHITTIAVDDSLYIDGLPEEKQSGTKIRRVDGKRLSDEEAIEYYTNKIHELGGKVNGYWLHGIAICKEGKIVHYEKKSYRIFTEQKSKKVPEGYPLDAISIVPEYQKYRSELTQEEKKEQQTIQNKELFDFIIKNI